FGLDVHDMNWIKAFRREVTDSLALRSSWHRYILVMAHNEGWRIGEVRVPYEPRQAGRSKFGFSRLPVSFLDVVTLKFLLTFQRRPAIFFGALGSGMIGAGVLLWAYLLWSFLSSHTQYRPLMLVAGIAMLAGLLVILVGFLAELVVNVSERVERLERRLEDDQR
ncbi:MAG TPA: glycosyltransferase, partial [Actinomycetes bacterium]|nr:glycosyltransferase [Actinomycetes bacterium]